MTTLRQQLNQHNPLGTAWIFALAVFAFLPALLFSHLMPAWTPLIALAGLLVIFLLRSAATSTILGHTPINWTLLFLLLLLPVGLWVTKDVTVTLPYSYAFIANITLFWAVAAQRNTLWVRHTGWILLLGGLILAAIILFGTRFSSQKLPFVSDQIYALLPGGWQAFWDQDSFNPNNSGGLLALFLLPVLILVWMGDSWQQRDLTKLIALVLAVLLLLTQSRGALLAVAGALVIITSLYNRRWWIFWLVVVAITQIATHYFGTTSLIEGLLGRSNVLEDQNLQSRWIIWQNTLYLIQDFPLTGVGLGMLEPAVNLHYPTAMYGPDWDINHAHNIFLQIGAEMGLPGLVAHLLFYFFLFRLLLRQALNPQAGRYRGLALGLLGSFVTFLTHGLFDAIIASPQVAFIIWGLFGLMVAVATSSPETDSTTHDRQKQPKFAHKLQQYS